MWKTTIIFSALEGILTTVMLLRLEVKDEVDLNTENNPLA